MKTTSVQGTSIEVLAPFLPYGIEVKSQWTDGSQNTTGLLKGIDTVAERPVIWHNGEDDYTSAYKHVLPVLRPFTDLVKPLPNGDVPACALAQMVVADDVFLKGESAILDDSHYDEDTETEYPADAIYVSAKDEFTGEQIEVTIYSDWSCDQIVYAPAAFINYLRANHFAVGLEPHQYIRKTS